MKLWVRRLNSFATAALQAGVQGYTCPVMANVEFEVQLTHSCTSCGAPGVSREAFNNLSVDLLPWHSMPGKDAPPPVYILQARGGLPS
ncbi:ubiquitin carboxyl-terminal hydrolase 37-like isoform X2 [Amia ocellicauda]|uniref:ubiquitin carboxyl-terminal hydrolase 37-like isoform X2 n=1 Tax=Amia ocellicauda TaxID=2972642 RepID=UPI003464E399